MADDPRQLLAAQAQGGTAGVNAYKQAQADMEARRQAAIAAALVGSTERGASAGASTLAQADAVSGIDRVMANSAARQADYEASMAGRDARMAAYTRGVGEAATLIPAQAAAAQGLIRSQGDARLAQLGAQQRFQLSQAEQARRDRLAEIELAQANRKEDRAFDLWLKRVEEERQRSKLSGANLQAAAAPLAKEKLEAERAAAYRERQGLGERPAEVKEKRGGGFWGAVGRRLPIIGDGPVKNKPQVEAAKRAIEEYDKKAKAADEKVSLAEQRLFSPEALDEAMRAAVPLLQQQGFEVDPASLAALGGRDYRPGMSASSFGSKELSGQFAGLTGLDLPTIARTAGMDPTVAFNYLNQPADATGRELNFNLDTAELMGAMSDPDAKIGEVLNDMGVTDPIYRQLLTAVWRTAK